MYLDEGLDSPPSSWCVICRDRLIQVLLAKEEQLYLVDYTDAHEQVRAGTALGWSVWGKWAWGWGEVAGVGSVVIVSSRFSLL